jgi:hypothetical protein
MQTRRQVTSNQLTALRKLQGLWLCGALRGLIVWKVRGLRKKVWKVQTILDNISKTAEVFIPTFTSTLMARDIQIAGSIS